MNATGVLLGSALAAAALLAGCGSDSETITVTETQTVATSTGTAATTTEPSDTTSTTAAETTTTETGTTTVDETSCPAAESPPNILNVVPTGVDCATVESAMAQINSVGKTFALGEFQCDRTSGVRFSGIWTCVGAGGSFTFDFGD